MLKDQIALVTGASSGIGYHTALLLASKGVKVFALARREVKLKSLQNESKNIVPIVADVTKDVDLIRDQISNEPIDILVNNAGLAWGIETIDQAPQEKWNTMIDTNVKALIACTQLVLPKMVERKTGSIVNVGSVAAYEYYKGGAVYCASKAAVRALTKAWREDLIDKGIRVIGIHPGMVDTEFSRVRFDGDRGRAEKVYDGVQPLSGKDVAEAIVWSLSCPQRVNVESMILMPTAQASVFNTYRGES